MAGDLTLREKIAHLLRRFGLGATRAELDELEKLGLEGAIHRLLDYDAVDPGIDPSPWEFAFTEGDQLNLDSPRFAQYWTYRMLMTRRPVEEKLTLFWHDHFAVSAAKVEFGPMMLEYLNTLRSHACGNFRTMLGAISRDPAMMQWLDLSQSNKFSPNENFARELLELFTMSKGYTESDVKEVARAFTGWSAIPTWLDPQKGDYPDQIKRTVKQGGPLILFIIVPLLQDTGTKTILGQTGNFDQDDVLDMLVARPETAENVTTKLWEFFAYPNPEPSVKARLQRAFVSSKYEIRPVLHEIAKSDEFYSAKCVRTKVKSPVDFTVALLRQLELQPILKSLRKPDAKLDTPIANEITGATGFLVGWMNQQGMLLLYPPDVGGWEWGEKWITSAAMLARMQTADLLFGNDKEVRPLTDYVAKQINGTGRANSLEVARAFADRFDASIPQPKLELLADACEKRGGPQSLLTPAKAAPLLGEMGKLLFGMPEFNMG